MEPASRKWLKKLHGYFIEDFNANDGRFSYAIPDDCSETFVYKLLHKTGLIFGYPVEPFALKLRNFGLWSDTEKIKVIYSEALYCIYFSHLLQSEKKIDNIETVLAEADEKIFEFYQFLFPEYKARRKKWLVKNKPTNEKIELIVNKRLRKPNILNRRFWKGTQFNAFVFLDAVFFASWLKYPQFVTRELYADIQMVILQSIIIAMYSNKVIDAKNRTLLNYFVASANLPLDRQEDLALEMQMGLDLDSVHIPEQIPVVYKRIFLEMAMLSIIADKQITEEEEYFIKGFAKKLEMPHDEIERSLLFTETFVYKNYDEVVYLNSKHSFDILSKSITSRMHSFIKKNKASVIQEVSESRELLELLWKAKHEKLSATEKEKVRNQLVDLLKTIPSLAVFMVPGGSVLLPIILRVLPEELLVPSSFRN